MGIKTEERLEAVAAGFPPGPYGGTIPPYHTTKKWIFHPLIFTNHTLIQRLSAGGALHFHPSKDECKRYFIGRVYRPV